MSSISNWYHNQYSTWNRTRRLQASPFLARSESVTSRRAVEMARTATRDAVDINTHGDDSLNLGKKQETLFGPNIGPVNKGPLWAQSQDTRTPAHVVSSDIIKTWIAKSKEPSQPTTTLQALVNLKRPSLHLVPLTAAPDEDPSREDPPHHHGLEFEYDCDAPKCRVTVNVILPAHHPLAENVDDRGFSRICVYETVVEGGFSQVLKLEDGASLELGRFEPRTRQEGTAELSGAAGDASLTEGMESTSSDAARHDRSRRRFSVFHFRKRAQARSASGPALAVVDADHNHHTADDDKEHGAKEDMEDGVRVTIQLSALDADGITAAVNNEQVTYLHVVRLGTHSTESEEDTRPWVVRVIKRDAIIGPYAFQLHEIYGLSSRSQPSTASNGTHTYPPTMTTSSAAREEEPSSECLLCLSSPREVILLPCRHLVACKECAINMVEFGAGGTIVQPSDTTNTNNTAAPAEGGEGTSTSAASAAPTGSVTTTAPPHPRRKRRAKGWFCPVCRQPYTSLLRVSASPHTKVVSDDDQRTSIEDPEHKDERSHDSGRHPDHHEQEQAPSSDDPRSADPATQPTVGGGLLNVLHSSLRRNLHGGNQSFPPDVERGVEISPAVA